MNKVLIFGLLVGLSSSLGCGSAFDDYPIYTPKDEKEWKEKLEHYYKQPLELNLTWHYGPLEETMKDCAPSTLGGCTVDGNVLLPEEKKEDCYSGLHEMMHNAMFEVYGDVDMEHTRADWGRLVFMCFKTSEKGEG